MTRSPISVVDLGLDRPRDPAARAAAARTVARACSTDGFFVVSGHGVPRATIEAVYDATSRFFVRPESAKAALAAEDLDPLQRGFVRGELETYSLSRMGEPSGPGRSTARNAILSLPNKWPSDLPGFREACLAYYEAVQAVALEVVRLFAIALALPEDWFDGKFDDHMTQLAVNYYRPGTDVATDREFRNDPHQDWGTLTLLHQGDSPGGLQILNASGVWIDIPPRYDTFVVHCGDLMSRWTNDRWVSAIHRVLKPAPEHARFERQSLAFFYEPNPDTVIDCIPTCTSEGVAALHPPVTTYDYLSAKVRRAYLLGRRAKSDR